MFKKISLLYTNSVQETIREIANHILVIIAFFLPISQGAVKSGFFILIALFLLQKNPLLLLFNVLKNRVIQAMLMIWMIHIIGISYAEQHEISAHYAGEMKFFLYSLLVVVFAQHRFLYRIFGAFILGVFLSELLSYSYFFGLLTEPLPSLFSAYSLTSKNEPSPFTYHIEYGYILAVTSSFIFLRFLKSDSTKEKILLALFFSTITLNVFLNSARTGYILFFITNVTVLISYYKNTFYKRLIYFIPFGIIILCIAWFSSSNIQREYHETVDSLVMLKDNNLNSSIGNRVNMALTGVSAINQGHLWLGFGTGMQGKAVYDEAVKNNNIVLIDWMPDSFYTGYKSILDCTYSDILVQFGLIGFVFLFYYFFQVFCFSQSDPLLNTMKHAILFSAIFYALVSSLFFGVLVPMIIVILISFTLVQPNTLQLALSPITKKTMALYTISTISLFTLSKLT